MKFDHHALKGAAKTSLAGSAFDHRRLVLIHTGAVCLANILIALLVFCLNREIESTSGIGGVDRRNLLSTITAVAQLAQIVFFLFWGFGYTSAAMDLARDHQPEQGVLLDGFRHFGPILRLTFLKGLLMGGVLFFSIQVASFFFCMTPWAAPLVEFTETYLEATDYAAMEEALLAVIEQIRLPMMSFTAVAFVVLAIVVLCRFRFADLIAIQSDRTGKKRRCRLMEACYPDFIHLVHIVLWMHHGIGKRAITGQNQKAFGIHIQPSYRIDTHIAITD